MAEIGWLALTGAIDASGVIPWRMATSVNGTIMGGVEDFDTYFNYTQAFTTVTQTKL